MARDKSFDNQDPARDSSRHSASPECWASRGSAKTTIILLTIYSKSDLTDIPNKVIEEIIHTFESED